jgi:hypothetical protein
MRTPTKGIEMTHTIDGYEKLASDLYDEQMARYVKAKMEASAFLSQPYEKVVREEIDHLCELSSTADPLDYAF